MLTIPWRDLLLPGLTFCNLPLCAGKARLNAYVSKLESATECRSYVLAVGEVSNISESKNELLATDILLVLPFQVAGESESAQAKLQQGKRC